MFFIVLQNIVQYKQTTLVNGFTFQPDFRHECGWLLSWRSCVPNTDLNSEFTAAVELQYTDPQKQLVFNDF